MIFADYNLEDQLRERANLQTLLRLSGTHLLDIEFCIATDFGTIYRDTLQDLVFVDMIASRLRESAIADCEIIEPVCSILTRQELSDDLLPSIEKTRKVGL